MNSIPTIQNSDKQLLRLAAQRQLYATAKSFLAIQLIIVGPVAVMMAFTAIVYPEGKGFIALEGLLATFFDLVCFTPWQKSLRELAAKVQELFDCDVLELPWDELKVGRQPDHELIVEQSKRYASWSSKMTPLIDWYAKDVGALPLHIARIICQRSNCWWDAKQRRRYATTIIVGVSIIFFTLLFIGMYCGATIENFVLIVAAPVAPALFLGYKQYFEQSDAANRLDKLKEHSERLWRDAIEQQMTEQEVTTMSRGLQNEIFENRKHSPLIFDIIFKRLRRDYEVQMNLGAEELVKEAKKRLRLP
jgi:hypothetical protein